MLKLTKKADYGLMALKYLAERADAAAAKTKAGRIHPELVHPETVALSAKDIADAYGIPAQLLAKILQQLTKAGLLKSHAGMNGGYALSKEARTISAYEVILAIDGREPTSGSHATRILSSYQPGEKISLPGGGERQAD